MAAKVRKVGFTVSIGGTQIPIKSAHVVGSSSGQLATATATSSIALLTVQGIDIFGLSQSPDGATYDVFGGYDGNYTRLFSGILDEAHWDLHDDMIELKAVDFGIVLRDTLSSIASLKSYKGMSIGNIVTSIANMFGFTPNVTDPGLPAGPVINDENTYNPHPQSYWQIIQNLAEQVGYEFYVLPDKTLFFGPETTNGTIDLTWGAKPTDNPANPLKELSFLYQPRNNNNFKVKVISYNPNNGSNVSGTKDASGITLRKKRGRKSPTEIVGTSNGTTSSVHGVGSSGAKPSKKPTFTFFADGLTPEACEMKAEGIAKDIAKRLVIIEGELEGQPDIKLHTEINLVQGQLDTLGFDALVYSVSEFNHSYTFPGSGKSGGYMTHFKALALIDTGN